MKRGTLGRPRLLTPDEIVQLREDWTHGHRVLDMAFKYGTSPTTINRIIQAQRFPARPRPKVLVMNRAERRAVPKLWRCPACLSIHSGVCPHCEGE